MVKRNDSARILVINGSYRDDGVIDRVVEVAVTALQQAGAAVDHVYLREHPIEFCLNCRECTQKPGEAPGQCVQQDGMKELIERIEQADAFILASPTNFGSVTAVFKRFMERLIVYSYWPWGNKYPRFRKANSRKKKALLISSSAAPGFLGRWMYNTGKQLKTAAQTIGAEPAGNLFTGGIDNDLQHKISPRIEAKARTMAGMLLDP
ncbi:MAG: flavodoxin family protein [Gammaproteobacteria bacterium]|nr:flavodoxin family protein [Gammaproteobacteria bacterium]